MASSPQSPTDTATSKDADGKQSHVIWHQPEAQDVIASSPLVREPESPGPARLQQTGLKLIPFIDIAPFPLFLQRLLGWRGLRGTHLAVLFVLHFPSKLWFLLLMFEHLGWCPAAAFLISMVNVYLSMLSFAHLINGPFPLPSTDGPAQIATHTASVRRRFVPSFIMFSVPNFAMWFWAFWDSASLSHSAFFNAVIPASVLTVLGNIGLGLPGTLLASHFTHQLDVMALQWLDAISSGQMSFQDSVEWTILMSKHVRQLNRSFCRHLSVVLLLFTAVCVLWAYAYFVTNMHTSFLVLMLFSFGPPTESLIKLARFNSAKNDLISALTIMRSNSQSVSVSIAFVGC